MMLTGYMDETGHSKDERQRFVGMAGLIAPPEDWEVFERKWKAALADFKIPFFHMKDFANLRGPFKGWSELKRRKLFGKLLRIMAAIHPLPVGSITSMEDFRSLPEEDREIVKDPYYFSFIGCVYIPASLLQAAAPGGGLALVFGEQTEFEHTAGQLFEIIKQEHEVGARLAPLAFRDMKSEVPLQAADIVAYEFYKEVERLRYRPQAKPRYGYEELTKMALRAEHENTFFFNQKHTLLQFAEDLKRKRLIRESGGSPD